MTTQKCQWWHREGTGKNRHQVHCKRKATHMLKSSLTEYSPLTDYYCKEHFIKCALDRHKITKEII